MSIPYRLGCALMLLGSLVFPAAAQEKVAAPVGGVAATVNDQPIPEVAVQRALKRIPPAKHAEARPELVEFLIDNVLIDQYLARNKVTADPKDVEARMKQVKDELQKQGQSFEKMLTELMLTEDEMRAQITSFLCWDKYVTSQATDQALRQLFEKNPEMFDGTMVRARHILLTPASGDPAAAERAKGQLLAYKKQVETLVAEGLAKLPAQTDNLEREKQRYKLTDEAFATLAREKSDCPSKAQGGDLNWFPRAGSMVEPFARAAFALKLYEMSDVVSTRFGYHLILATDRKAGKPVTFDEVKDVVKEIYGDQLRDALLAQLRPTAKIVITPPKP
jgi:peptidyl-prolyl cis-trans isomerase C